MLPEFGNGDRSIWLNRWNNTEKRTFNLRTFNRNWDMVQRRVTEWDFQPEAQALKLR